MVDNRVEEILSRDGFTRSSFREFVIKISELNFKLNESIRVFNKDCMFFKNTIEQLPSGSEPFTSLNDAVSKFSDKFKKVTDKPKVSDLVDKFKSCISYLNQLESTDKKLNAAMNDYVKKEEKKFNLIKLQYEYVVKEELRDPGLVSRLKSEMQRLLDDFRSNYNQAMR